MPMKNRVKALVDSRGITVYRFWQDTGISRNTAYDLYNNPSRFPTAEVMAAIISTYGVEPNDIVEFVAHEDAI